MSSDELREFDDLVLVIEEALDGPDLPALTAALADLNAPQIIGVIERLNEKDRAIVYRLLPKTLSLEVFEGLAPSLQSEIVDALHSKDVADIFSNLDPDDRVGLLDELPATVAARLLRGLPTKERNLTSEVLGYPQGSIGRRMSPEFIAIKQSESVAQALTKVRGKASDAETIYTLPVIDSSRTLVGVVSLRDLMTSPSRTKISKIMSEPLSVNAIDDEEFAARTCSDLKVLALPVVDNEDRLVGILTVDDALRILEEEESEDAARIGGAEPLRRPYLATPVFSIVRSRVIWLLVLALGATFTVSVIGAFEVELSKVVALTLFIPLLIGTGGNTGNQAATTVTRALALQDVRAKDIGQVLFRELRVGLLLGLLLGSLGFSITTMIFGLDIGIVIGLTLLSICTVAATIGGVMPLIGLALRADPAVFSNPFITTFVDSMGLIIYFLIAQAVLGI
ncbi:MAG: magnesium transporter [Actinomycetota bacterium]